MASPKLRVCGYVMINAKQQHLTADNMALVPSRGLYLYLNTLRTAMADDIITDDEAAILHVLSTPLGVSPSETAECISVVKGEEKDPFAGIDVDYSGHHVGDVATYQSALIAALDDEVISEDEWGMINYLRKLIGLQIDQHALIEEAIRAMAEVDENGIRRVQRLERFNIVCPFVV